MIAQYQALAIHYLTASGAVFAMLALLAAVENRWDEMFWWLVVAFFIDGADGPLARKFDVKANAPRFDGVLLDLIVDYLTYVFIPAYALYASGIMDGWTGWAVLIVITFASAIYFADTRMKTKDNSFWGFPGCWNMAVLVIFTIKPGYWEVLIVVCALACAMFLPLKFIHPMRTKRWRYISLPVSVVWAATALWVAHVNFNAPIMAQLLLFVTSCYLLFAGIVQQLWKEREPV